MSTLTVLGKAAMFVSMILGYAQMESKEHVEYRYGVLTTVLFLILVGSPLLNIVRLFIITLFLYFY